MGNILIDGIYYSNLASSLSGGLTTIGGSKIGNAAKRTDKLKDGATPAKVINAVEIDWNGMVLGDKTINTTGELFSV